MKKINLIILLLASFAIIGCGGGSSSGVKSGTSSASEPEGKLDNSFGNSGNGIVVYDKNDSKANSAIIDSQGRLVIVGSIGFNKEYMTIWRYSIDGNIDTSFGNNGVVTFKAKEGYGKAISEDENGTLTVSGQVTINGSKNIAIWRYKDDGSLETQFNQTGYEFIPGGDNKAEAVGAEVVNSTIVVNATLGNAAQLTDIAMFGLNLDGTINTIFNNGTISLIYGTQNGKNYANSTYLDGKKVYIVGLTVDSSAKYNSAIIKFEPTNIAKKFAITQPALNYGEINKDERIYAITKDKQGRVVVVGNHTDYTNNNEGGLFVARFIESNSGLTLDTSFNTTGFNVIKLNLGLDFGKSVKVLNNGKILITGFSANGAAEDMFIARLNSNGSLDTSFNQKGFLLFGNSGTFENGNFITTDFNDKIIVVGMTAPGAVVGINGPYRYMSIWRYK